MTIDEAIALVKLERECVIRADNCDRKCEKCDLLQDSSNLIDMYDQLAEWLEELKAIKEKGRYVQGFKAGYKVAINDAKSIVLQTLDNEMLVDTLHLRLERLKAGY